MNKLFVDANVLVAVIIKEYPMFGKANRVLSMADHLQFQLYTSPLALVIAIYFADSPLLNCEDSLLHHSWVVQ